MSKKAVEDESINDRANLDDERRREAIRGRVLRMLGPPPRLLSVQVRLLWEDHFRVNILVGADVASATVAHSYFLVADNAGQITRSTPEIAKRY